VKQRPGVPHNEAHPNRTDPLGQLNDKNSRRDKKTIRAKTDYKFGGKKTKRKKRD